MYQAFVKYQYYIKYKTLLFHDALRACAQGYGIYHKKVIVFIEKITVDKVKSIC